MACLKGKVTMIHKKILTHSVRNKIVTDLVTQMYCINPIPAKSREYHAFIIILTLTHPLCFGSRPTQHTCSFAHVVRDGF